MQGIPQKKGKLKIKLMIELAYSNIGIFIPCQTFKVEPFAKTFNYLTAIIMFMKNTISDILQTGF